MTLRRNGKLRTKYTLQNQSCFLKKRGHPNASSMSSSELKPPKGSSIEILGVLGVLGRSVSKRFRLGSVSVVAMLEVEVDSGTMMGVMERKLGIGITGCTGNCIIGGGTGRGTPPD